MQTARGSARPPPWLDQCLLSARDLAHPAYSATQLQAVPGVAVQRIRNSYNPAAPPRFRKVLRRIGADGKVQYAYIQDEQGVYNKDGSFVRAGAAGAGHRRVGTTAAVLAYDTSAVEFSAQDVQYTARARSHVIANNSERMQLSAPDSPIETQRSTQRVRQLQALLGDHIATTHGRPPPRAAPYFQSGALRGAEDTQLSDTPTPVLAFPAA